MADRIKLTWHRDGSYTFKDKVPDGWAPQHFLPDPENPLHWVPNYPPCTHRITLFQTTNCGKQVHGGEMCRHFGRLVTPPDCSGCAAIASP